MLRVGLTGGIGAGKSTVARRLVELGAVLVDADVVARAVVAPGTEGLRAVAAEFGPDVLGRDGSLDRAALAAVVFADNAARQRLNDIVHPLVRARSAELMATAAPDAVVVQDVPLLVETGQAPTFHLVVVVHAAPAERIRRLAAERGMAADEARARIAMQVDDATRRAAADVWLGNDGSPTDLLAAVDRLWSERLVPFEENLRLRRAVPEGTPRVLPPDPRWPADAARLVARVALACRLPDRAVQHVGSTAVPGLLARDIVDLAAVTDAPAELEPALLSAGFPPGAPDAGGQLSGQLYGGADPGRPVRLAIFDPGAPAMRRALLQRDWLRADHDARGRYAEAKRRLAAAYGADPDPGRYAAAKHAWLNAEAGRMEEWAAAARWDPVGAARA